MEFVTHKDIQSLREAVRSIRIWKDGNGAIGAEQRLQRVEERCDVMEKLIDTNNRRIEEDRAHRKKRDRNFWVVIGFLATNLLSPIILKFLGV